MQPTDLDTVMMRLALNEAEQAAAIGEVPIGAVVYRGDQVIAKAHNMREHWADPTAHAEMIALREASKKLGTWRLDGCRLAVTLEPCPMCAGALVNSRLQAVVYGITDPKMGCVETLHHLLDTEAFNHRVQWHGGVLAEESLTLLQSFFKARRGKHKPEKPAPEPSSSDTAD